MRDLLIFKENLKLKHEAMSKKLTSREQK